MQGFVVFEVVQQGMRNTLRRNRHEHGGARDPLPMLQMFDKQLTVRMGQANVRRWVDDLLPLVTDGSDPLNVADLTTHRLPLSEGPAAYATFQQKVDGAIKIVLKPGATADRLG